VPAPDGTGAAEKLLCAQVASRCCTAEFNRSAMAGAANCIDILIAIILPPLGVFLKFGCGHEFWICLLLTFLGYIPGIIYAIYAITKYTY
ncbi:hypothetical protein EJB05_33986, partial [Eragrostis curvula]